MVIILFIIMVLHTQLTLAKNSDNKQHLALVLSVCCLDVRGVALLQEGLSIFSEFLAHKGELRKISVFMCKFKSMF